MRSIKFNSESQSSEIRILGRDGLPQTTITTASGLTLQYLRQGGTPVTIPLTDLPSINAAWSAGGFIHVGSGIYRVDLPDAACAIGSTELLVYGNVPAGIVIPAKHPLVAYDPETLEFPSGPTGPAGPIGPTGPTGPTGPNEITAATATDLTGVLVGDGMDIGAIAYAATSTANAIVQANSSGKIANDWLNTGSGGGIDADTLDGSHAAAFAAAVHTHAISDVTNLQTSLDAKASLSGATFTGPVVLSPSSGLPFTINLPSGHSGLSLEIKNSDATRIFSVNNVGRVDWAQAAAGNLSWTARVSGDSSSRIQVRADGQLEFGSGSAATDVRLRRSATSTLAVETTTGTPAAFVAGAVQIGTGSTMPNYEHRTFGDAYVGGGLNVGNTTVTNPIEGGVYFSRSGSSEPFIHFSNSDGSTELGQVRGLSGGGIRFTNGNFTTEWVRITPEGRLGIGIPIASSNSAVTDAITVRGNALLGPGNNSANADLRLHSDRLWAVRSGTGGGFAIYDATSDTSRLILSSTGDAIINGPLQVQDSSPVFRLAPSGSTTTYSRLTDNGTALLLDKYSQTGEAGIYIAPRPTDGTSSANFRIFRATNTTGPCFVDVCRGNGNNDINTRLGANGLTYLNALVGNVGVGISNPTSKFHVVGNSYFDGSVQSSDKFLAGPNGLFFASDPDTGIRNLVSNNTIEFVIGGNQLAYLNSAGLTVSNSANTTDGTIRAVTTAGGYGLRIQNAGEGGADYRIGVTRDTWGIGGGKFIITPTTASADAVFTIFNGKIGIGPGNTSPTEALDVAGNAVIRTGLRVMSTSFFENYIDVRRGATGNGCITGRVTGDSGARWNIYASGLFEISDGSSAADVRLFRSAAGVWRMDSTVVPNVHLNLTGGLIAGSMADSVAPNNSLYFSTTASKLAYKDAGGSVHTLY